LTWCACTSIMSSRCIHARARLSLPRKCRP
jgi:hypothetical protein